MEDKIYFGYICYKEEDQELVLVGHLSWGKFFLNELDLLS